jgi:hypothetical protein
MFEMCKNKTLEIKIYGIDFALLDDIAALWMMLY